jgi:hypothetical protein
VLLGGMTNRSYDDLDRAVLLARRAATTGRIDRPEALTRFLYQRWYLGKLPGSLPTGQAASPPVVPADGEGPQRHAHAPGPWRSWSRRWEERSCRGSELVRMYLSCAPRTSLHVVGAVGAHAQEWDHPWLLSSRAMAQPVPSPDSTVLYLPIAALEELREPITAMTDDIRPFLGSTVPALTLRVAPGVSLAQNPADGRGFGEHRCAIIASTVLAHQRRGHREIVERTLAAFRRAGVDPQAPYRALDAAWTWTPQRLVSRRAA